MPKKKKKPATNGPTGERNPGIGNLLFDVWLVSRATTALIDDAVRPSGLDADEFAVYSVLASSDGMTPSDLADWMAAPATTVSSYVRRFENRGHVERVANPEDRRSYRIQLTKAGRTTHVAAGELFRPVLNRVTELVGTEAPKIQRHLRTLHDVVKTPDDGDLPLR
jgi:DNA-binding MarR family transcriptional regulator